ncbi:BOLA class I histocompatibility antigen, alpha chain BL3-7-like isoform X3 [Acipenser ruthenus]|uniref:BOLA class I histocompatibility antigen, alpha chain BL3-7-like isoform X3 n=1 Tax=Acipenser ruthenus TaxID=7906 RepID=UPI002740D815|nr:BOLA class I histocompatibility antigen, alpha chain BL3-7-like isoform X3 [Acipenser ruthenus]
MIRMSVLGVLCWVHAAAAGTHSLLSFGVATSEGTELSEHIAVGMVDDVQYSYFNSTVGKPIPMFDWMTTTMGREFWDRRSWHILLGHDIMKWRVRNIVQHFNHTGVRPEVMLIPRKARNSPGTDVICHVTGFYPREVEVNWVRDGEHLLDEGVWSGEVLPNGDRTYQLRKILTVSPEEQKKHSYSCQVDHASLDEKMIVKWVPEAALNMGFVAGGVLAALGLIIAVIIGVHIWKKRASGARRPDYTPAQTKEQSDASFNCTNNDSGIQCSQSTAPLPDEDVQKATAAVSMSSLAGSAEEARGFD